MLVRFIQLACVFLAGVFLGMILQIEVEIKHTSYPPNHDAVAAEQRKRGVTASRT